MTQQMQNGFKSKGGYTDYLIGKFGDVGIDDFYALRKREHLSPTMDFLEAYRNSLAYECRKLKEIEQSFGRFYMDKNVKGVLSFIDSKRDALASLEQLISRLTDEDTSQQVIPETAPSV